MKSFWLTLLCIAVICYLCFFTPPHTNLDHVPFIDKWTHICMYAGTLCVFWIEYWRFQGKYAPFRPFVLFFWSFAFPIAMGGIIEILQAYCTGGRRSGEWADLAADSIGVVLSYLIGRTLLKHIVARVKKSEN